MKKRLSALVLLLVAAGAFAIALLAPLPADAIPVCGWHADYYSDPGHTILIGERWVTPKDCGCYYTGWGSAAGYQVVGGFAPCSTD